MCVPEHGFGVCLPTFRLFEQHLFLRSVAHSRFRSVPRISPIDTSCLSSLKIAEKDYDLLGEYF